MLIFVCLSEVKIPTLVILSVAKYLNSQFVILSLAKYLVTQKEILRSLRFLAMTKNQKEIFH